MLVKQAESAANQQNFVQQAGYQRQSVAPVPDNPTMFVNPGIPFETTVPGHEEVMDHSGAYDSASQQVFSSASVDNTQLSQQGMPPAGQVLMDISSGNPAGDYSFDYNSVMQGQSFTAQMEQTMTSQSPGFLPPNKQHPSSPSMQNTVLTSPVEQPQMMSYSNSQQQQQSPLEEIQAQQLAAQRGTALSPTQFVGNIDPFNSSRQTDTLSQPRKGRLPRNVSDSQLYTMDLSQLGTTFQTNLFPSMESNLPPQLEAPNLAAHLQSIQPRTRITSTPPAASQAKRARLPRNMSDSRLSSLASMSRSPTSPPSLPTLLSSDVTKQLSQSSSSSMQPSRLSALKGRKQGRLPRNMSDSSLLNLVQQPQRVPSPGPSQRRRKMSDPQQVLSAAALGANLQGSAVPSVTFTSSAATQLYSTSSNLQSGEAHLLEQLLSAPSVSNNSPLNVVSSVSTVPHATESFQSVNNSVLGQLLTQQSPVVSAPAVQLPAQETNTVGGTQDPALLSQLYQLRQMLQSKQTSSVPAELVNALNSLTNTGAMPVAQPKQEQSQPVVQQKNLPVQPSLQMKPKNQNVITQALQSLLRAPSNVAIETTTQNPYTNQVSSLSAQTSCEVPNVVTSQNTPQGPNIAIKQQPQGKPSVATVYITPQGSIQPVQDTHTQQMPELPPTPMPQVVNIEPVAVQGQRIILPANVNLSTLSLAQLGLSTATLQPVSLSFPSGMFRLPGLFSARLHNRAWYFKQSVSVYIED